MRDTIVGRSPANAAMVYGSYPNLPERKLLQYRFSCGLQVDQIFAPIFLYSPEYVNPLPFEFVVDKKKAFYIIILEDYDKVF